MGDPKKPYGSVSYADPGYHDGVARYPINTKAHVKAAWSYINMPKNAAKYTSEQLKLIKGRIRAAAKRLGIQISDDGGRNRLRWVETEKGNDMSVDAADREEFGEESLKAAVLAENRERIYTSQWKVPCPVELRSGKDSRMIGGYALKFDRLSQNLGGYVERIAPSFANQSRADGWPDVVCRYNHNDELLLGTTRSGTLQLSTDDVGLFYEVDVPQCRGDVLEMVVRRDVAHSSFAFEVHEQEWGVSEQNFPQRTLISGRIIDVAPVSSPAYRDTTVAMRSLAEFLDVPIEDVLEAHREKEIRKFFVRTDNGGETAKPRPPVSAMAAKMALLAKRGVDPIGGDK